MSNYTINDKGIVVPKQEVIAFRCRTCPEIILKDNEAKGRLFLVDGQPMCARCRILRHGKMSRIIRADAHKYAESKAKQEAIKQEAANASVLKIAADTQKATKTLSNKKR